MMKQYFDDQGEVPRVYFVLSSGAIFYEMFFDDAILVSRQLELTLTGRDCGQEERAPMLRRALSRERKLLLGHLSERVIR